MHISAKAMSIIASCAVTVACVGPPLDAGSSLKQPAPSVKIAVSAEDKTPAIQDGKPLITQTSPGEELPATVEVTPTQIGVNPVVARDTPYAQRQPTSTPIPSSPAARLEGTVLSAKLNVRSSPGLSGEILGQLSAGERIQIVGRREGWLQIRFPAAPGAIAWTSANYIAVDGEPTPYLTNREPQTSSAEPSSSSLPAPRSLSHENDTFSWKWNGSSAIGEVDWYFDIQIYRGSDSDPYHIIVAEPRGTVQVNGVWFYKYRFRPECDSFWLVQIARRVDARFAGWISPRSGRLRLGPTCGSGGVSTPQPPPTRTPSRP
jgi:hypothetical protein